MYTDPTIVNGAEVSSRCYVRFYYHGKLKRVYNGKPLGLRVFPNESKNVQERQRQLEQLRFEIKKHLEKGWNPSSAANHANPYTGYSIQRCLSEVAKEILKEDISKRYIEDLDRIAGELQSFLSGQKINNAPCEDVDSKLLQRFLSKYSSSATYYMTKRRTLAGLFARMVNNGMLKENPVHKTARKKEVHTLNSAFPPKQMKGLLSHLEHKHPQLHLCALLMYGCFLRPHREVRLLKRKHLNDTCTKITLSGAENKSKRIRVISLPKYVTDALLAYGVASLPPESYVVNKGTSPINEDYFTTAWTREKKAFPKEFMIQEGQTLYSFRHSGAVAVFEKTKDAFKVQQAMGHSALTVTLRYLRSLGVSLAVEEFPDL